MNKRFKNVLQGIPQPTPPIWFMRQAGRYHSHYQNLRKKHTFEELCKHPELATEVACGPMIDFDYDVAILFSDILFPLEMLGLKLSYNPGPTFENYLGENDVRLRVKDSTVEEKLNFQVDALKLTRKALAKDKSLVGFIGGPWTILSYGMNMKNELRIKIDKEGMYIEKLLYDVLFPILRKNIQMQLDAGAEIVYIFDTNSVQLENSYYLGTYMSKMKSELFLQFDGRLAYFSKNQNFYKQNISVLSDYNLAGVVYPNEKGFIDFLKKEKNFFVQGNFSPKSLLSNHDNYLLHFENFVKKIKKLSLEEKKGWLCSLSHGVLPKTPEKNVKHFVSKIRKSFC